MAPSNDRYRRLWGMAAVGPNPEVRSLLPVAVVPYAASGSSWLPMEWSSFLVEPRLDDPGRRTQRAKSREAPRTLSVALLPTSKPCADAPRMRGARAGMCKPFHLKRLRLLRLDPSQLPAQDEDRETGRDKWTRERQRLADRQRAATSRRSRAQRISHRNRSFEAPPRAG